MTYKKAMIELDGELQEAPGIIKVLDSGVGVGVPNDPANRDWQEYQAWLAAGNEPLAADE